MPVESLNFVFVNQCSPQAILELQSVATESLSMSLKAGSQYAGRITSRPEVIIF